MLAWDCTDSQKGGSRANVRQDISNTLQRRQLKISCYTNMSLYEDQIKQLAELIFLTVDILSFLRGKTL